MTDSTDCIVIGGGIVGLAIGRALALAGESVVLLEANERTGRETSSRNSEVVHAGIYYPRGSLKARLCVEGRRRLYDYCADKSVRLKRCGKLIVAVDPAQQAVLDELARRAQLNGVDDVARLDRAGVEALEPELDVAAGVLSPSTGIVDSQALMLALQGDLESAGGLVATLSRFEAAEPVPGGLALTVDIEGEKKRIVAATVVNAAGLHASAVAAAFPPAARPDPLPQQRFAKGSYFAYAGEPPFEHLVYPLPAGGGLGIHATLDLAGRLRFGPDIEWVDSIDYDIDAARGDAFYAAIRTYWPGLGNGTLAPDYTGIRPKLHGPDEPATDFAVERAGCAVHLFGIESPGLTSCLTLADHVTALLEKAAGGALRR